jgi:RimJ/RimL family protein N-acetyltransferase
MSSIPHSEPVVIDQAALPLLRGKQVWLDPLTESHREGLRPLARDERIWEFTKTLLINDSFDGQFDLYFNEAAGLAPYRGQGFAIRAAKEDALIGMTRLYEIKWKDKSAEIGHTWYIPSVWGLAYNKECKLLLLQYVFETLAFNRLEFRVAGQNIRSQRAVAKIGGVKEGVLRKTGYRNDGSLRDTVIFSILDDEWPLKKQNLLRLISFSSTSPSADHGRV